ncbi:MAG: spore cortex-lytic protein, partial [Clostridia bacterium]|nr:spore cortex-lytic protein [Clostridia bacterium]
MPIYLPYVPEYIVVHLGAPDEPADNVVVSFLEYIKNVASSEIYPTWEDSAIVANMLAQVSFALNRVYTEFYRAQGYDFNITNNTAYDQKFIYGRTIFDNINQFANIYFNDYIRRVGYIEPLAAKYCNGTTVTCEGLSQWGSQNLAEQNYNSTAILY